MPTVDIHGVQLFYEQAGSGERVVMTHGAWTDGRTWEALRDRLVDRFEVVTWDRRGHSRSTDGDGPGSVKEDAADLAALIESLGPNRAHVVGNSAGGNVVLNLVTGRPELVKTAAVHEPGPFGLLEHSDDPRLVQLMMDDKRHTQEVERLIDRGEHERAAEYFVDQVAVGPGAWQVLPDALKSIMASNASTLADDLRDGWDVDSVDIEALAGSPVPLLISTGPDGPAMEGHAARELARRVPTAQLASIPGAGHIPHRTHPDEYASLISGFIEEAAITRSVS